MTAGTEGAGPVRAVWFDVGETLIDESREYGSWADWLGVPHRYGGVGLGRGLVALILSIVIVGFVAFLAVTRKDVDEGEAGRGRPAAVHARHRR